MERLVLNKLVRLLTGLTLFGSVAFSCSVSANSSDDYLALLQKEGKNHLLQIGQDRSACRTYLNPFGKYEDGIVETTVLVGDLGEEAGKGCRGVLSLNKVTMNCNAGKLVQAISDRYGYRELEMDNGASKLAAFALCLPKELLSQSEKLEEADNLMKKSSEGIYAGTEGEKRSALDKLKRVQEIYDELGNVGWRKGRNLAYLCDGYSLLGDWVNAQTFCQKLGEWAKESAITKHVTAKSLLMLASAYLGGGNLNETVKILEQIRSLDIKSECNSVESVECIFILPLLTDFTYYSSSDINQGLLVAIGDIYSYFGEYKKAIEYYNKVKNAFPEDKQAYIFAENCYGEGSDSNRKVYPKIGFAMLRDGNLSEALKDLNETCLGNKRPRQDLEELYMLQGRYKEAFDVSQIGVNSNTNFYKNSTTLEETNTQKATRVAQNTNSTLIFYSYVRDAPPKELVRDLSIFVDRKLFIYIVKPNGSIEARIVDIQRLGIEISKHINNSNSISQVNNSLAGIILITIAGGIAFFYRKTKKVLIITGITTFGLLSVLAITSRQFKPSAEVITKNLSLTRLLHSVAVSLQPDQNFDTSELENTYGCSQNGECLNYLYQVLIQPVSDLLPKNNERIIFFPDKDIFITPFAALKDSSDKYLIENYPISIAPSIYSLDELYRYSNSIWRPATEPALVVGNPIIPPVKISWGGAPILLESLPGTEFEAKEVSKLLNVTPLIGKEATKTAVIEKLKSAKILHFATHGYLKARVVNRPLEYRTLCYDGFGFYRDCSVYDEGQGALALTASDGSDGILSEVELSGQRVAAELTVLSACNTSLSSKSFYGGATGMASPFLKAGVPSVLASLWSIPDTPTSELMVEFYKNLKNNPDRSQALRLAQLIIMKKYSEPSNWAGFQLIGLSKNPPNTEVSMEQVFESVAQTVKDYLNDRNDGYLPFVIRTVTKKHRDELESMFPNEQSYAAQIPGLEKRINGFRFDLIPASLKFNDVDNVEVDVIIYSKKYHIVLKGSGSSWLVDDISGGIGVKNATPKALSQCKTATLVAREVNTQINIREGSGQQYTALNYGLPGDVVNLLASQNDSYGSRWYQVEFSKNKVKGWVKGDFLKINCQ